MVSGQRIALVITTLGLLACANSSPATTPTLSGQFVAAECDRFVRCTGKPQSTCASKPIAPSSLLPFGANGVGVGVLDSTNFGSFDAVLDSVAAGKITIDPDKLAACLADIRQLDCSSSLTEDERQTCAEVFIGQVPKGEHCIADEACAGRAVCNVPYQATGCEGKCAPLGSERCTFRFPECPAGWYCNGMFCEKSIPAGNLMEPCGDPVSCNEGLACNPACENDQVVMRCIEPVILPLGAECMKRAMQCGASEYSGWGSCAKGTACLWDGHSETGYCHLRLADGAECEDYLDCTSGYCDPSTHRCVPLPTSGPCVTTSKPICAPSSWCDETAPVPQCQPRRQAGEECQSPWMCMSPMPCVADSSGTLRCKASEPPPQSTRCQP